MVKLSVNRVECAVITILEYLSTSTIPDRSDKYNAEEDREIAQYIVRNKRFVEVEVSLAPYRASCTYGPAGHQQARKKP